MIHEKPFSASIKALVFPSFLKKQNFGTWNWLSENHRETRNCIFLPWIKIWRCSCNSASIFSILVVCSAVIVIKFLIVDIFQGKIRSIEVAKGQSTASVWGQKVISVPHNSFIVFDFFILRTSRSRSRTTFWYFDMSF